MKNSKSNLGFESNPLKVIIRGLDRLFNVNLAWGVIFLVLGVLSTPKFFGRKELKPSNQAPPAPLDLSLANIVALVLVGIGVIAVVILVVTFIEGVIDYVAYKTSKNEKTGFGEALSAVSAKYLTLLKTQILVLGRILGGLCFFIVPGVKAIFRYQFAFFPVFEKNASAREAVAQTKELTEGHVAEIFGFTAFSRPIPILGTALSTGALAEYYQQLKTLKAGGRPAPKTHWLNYLPAVIIAAIFIFAVASGVKNAEKINQPQNQDFNYGVDSA